MTISTVTYCPEDNKIRLYVGRVPRDEYERLRAAGFVSTPKQDCDFVATWAPAREDLAREYLDDDEDIGDEDYSPEERAADRAERFGEYRDKRAGEAGASADAFEAGPSAFGHQNRARAERQAARHDKKRVYAVSQWSKAEYWQARTAGVIRNALHKSSPSVRRGRILTLEAEQRKHEAGREEHRLYYEGWQKVAEMPGADELLPLDEEGRYADTSKMNPAQRAAYTLANAGSYRLAIRHPDSEEANAAAQKLHGQYWNGFSAYDFLTDNDFCGTPFRRLTPREYAALYLSKATNPEDYGKRWSEHYELRLTYERAMLANEGGSAAAAEMEPGGWIASRGRARGCLNDAASGWIQIQKVNKSPATGRVTSVQVWGTTTGYTEESGYTKRETRPALVTINVERMGEDAYRAPTAEEREAFNAAKKAAKKAKPVVSLINPTDADAEKLQARLNQDAADYARSKGRQPSEPREVKRITQAEFSRFSGPDGAYQVKEFKFGDVAFKCRKKHAGFYDYNAAESVIVLTDKPQKPLPAGWDAVAVEAEPETVTA